MKKEDKILTPGILDKIYRLKKEVKGNDEKILNTALDNYLIKTQQLIWARLGEELVHHKISRVCCSNIPIKVVGYSLSKDIDFWMVCEKHFKLECFHEDTKISMDVDPTKVLALKL